MSRALIVIDVQESFRQRPLDEPTAALDAETEHALFERYAEAARAGAGTVGRITILVSHRFSTVRMADLIVLARLRRMQADREIAAIGLIANLDVRSVRRRAGSSGSRISHQQD